uniref:(California timema) hypothetical protein n=1 Tax=Timema californicum TaxID=61474 RepID=A0A7R9P2H8_TIMCA|nr:unnamed protein product [Timema californicum]
MARSFRIHGYQDLEKTAPERKFPHIGPTYLLEICRRIGPILDKDIKSNVPGVESLLGAGRQSLLRTVQDRGPQSWGVVQYSARKRHVSFIDPPGYNKQHNIVRVLQGRETSGPLQRRQVISPRLYSKQQLLCRTVGHLSAVYCLLFDCSGRYIITGADDLLVKIWSAIDGRLMASLRGASAEITDIAINDENTLLAAGSLDKLLRVWNLQTSAPVAVLSAHTGMITSVNFCPLVQENVQYLVTTSTDGSVAFWSYQQMPDSTYIFQVYLMVGEEGPHRILETQAHTDRVDSIQWAHNSHRFISGSKDGTAHVWHYERQQWKSLRLLMSTKLPGCLGTDEDNKTKLKVSMVSWDVTDKWVITAVSDYTLKVWNANTGALVQVLRGHKDEVFVLESHPIDPHVLLSAGHDGQIFIWDIVAGTAVASFENTIEGQGHGAVFDAKWSPDGQCMAATDSHGHILMFGFAPKNELIRNLPRELFFHTDYRPLIRNMNHFVVDEQTQTAPHLMPPPFLVDVEGNPYPPAQQRLVPGREKCKVEQLIPNIIFSPGGQQEVIEGIPTENPRSNIDQMIAELVRNRGGQQENRVAERIQLNTSPRAVHRVGMRRTGDVEGVRQVSGNWQRGALEPWYKRTHVQPVEMSILQGVRERLSSIGKMELEMYRREEKRRPIPEPQMSQQARPPVRRHCGPRNPQQHNYSTRATLGTMDSEFENPENLDLTASGTSATDNDSTAREEDLGSSSSSSGSESSEYSDWIADAGVNLEPPKRVHRRPIKKRPPSSDTETKKPRGRQKKEVNVQSPPVVTTLAEVPEAFRPSEWLSEVIPRKAPYYPQMGDEVMYFRQGHQLYLNAVRNKKVYELGPRCEPWAKKRIRAHELVKIIGIKYEIRPPRLCCLKLGLMDEDGHLTGDTFTIKYHDMADVLDFLVLRQTYDTAIARRWKIGDRFRCMIDDGWWMGTIESHSALESDFPGSLFMCYGVRWDNSEYERMSPWDLEPVNPNRLPREVGGAVPVLPEEIQATLYQPRAEEWPQGDRDATCRRILAGLDQVMCLSVAESFIAPVDLNRYPTYAYVVEYPIDLSTIKGRFENRFYRRVTSAQFDVRYIATNAEKFNEPSSQIVKKARIATELCLKIMKDVRALDISAVYHQVLDSYKSSDSESEASVEVDINAPGPSRGRGSTRACRAVNRVYRREDTSPPTDWRRECRDLIDMLWMCEDSTPFREPVEMMAHPDYYQVIDTPMDLRTVKEDLIGGNYNTPLEFCKDVRLIFTNSKNYNTNKRSRVGTSSRKHYNESDDSLSDEVVLAARKPPTPRKQYTPRKNGTSRRKHFNESDDSLTDEEVLTARKPLTQRKQYTPRKNVAPVPRGRKRARVGSDSEDSYKPGRRPGTIKPKVRGNIRGKYRGKRKYKLNKERQPRGASRVVRYQDESDDVVEKVVGKMRSTRGQRLNYAMDSDASVSLPNNNVAPSDSSDSGAPRQARGKRPRKMSAIHYFEASDDSEGGTSGRRTRGKRTHYAEDSDDSDGALAISVSSRGRVRKLTPRARALLKF